MNMKRLLSLVAFFATVQASAQQVNPVPDYVFANRMSAGRNTVTDTAAYFSIGPRYGATRGMMPPMVVDTASFSANKRNGLLIFSVQKNKFLYWDSVGVKWAEMAGTAGTALTSADTAALLSTRAWRQKGIDSVQNNIALKLNTADTSSMLNNYTRGFGSQYQIPVYNSSRGLQSSSIRDKDGQVLTTSIDFRIGNLVSSNDVLLELGSSRSASGNTIFDIISDTTYKDYAFRIIRTDAGANAPTNFIHRGTGLFTINANEAANFRINTSATERFTILSTGNVGIGNNNPTSLLMVGNTNTAQTTPTAIEMDRSYRTGGEAFDKLKFYLYKDGTQSYGLGLGDLADVQYWAGSSSTGNHRFFTAQSEKVRFSSSGEVFLGNFTDNGDYRLQVSGNIYNTGSITTGAPSGGIIKPWKIGEATTVSPTSPNRTLRVEVDGVVYYIHAKTTND